MSLYLLTMKINQYAYKNFCSYRKNVRGNCCKMFSFQVRKSVVNYILSFHTLITVIMDRFLT